MSAPLSDHIRQLDQQYSAATYARFAPVLVRGEGCTVWDADGRAYTDFTSGIGVNSLGFADPAWVAAIAAQAGKLAHTSNLFYSVPAAELAQSLCEKSGLARVFFCNSGAEANECAIKAARKYSRDRHGAGRHTILTLQNSFHGRTLAALSATGQDVFHQHFFPFVEGFAYVPANDTAALEARLAQNDIAALMLEPVQGEGGVAALDTGYLQAARELCRRYDVLLVADEVQTGIGRSGRLFAFEHAGIVPDIVTLAKGLGGGLPVGAVLFGERCADTLGRGDHGSTFGGNPVCCAGALAVLARLDDAFLADVTRKGEALRQALAALPKVKSVSGLGLMLGVEFDDGISAADIVRQAQEKGVLFLTAKHKLRLLPPLIISDDDIARGIAVLREILSA